MERRIGAREVQVKYLGVVFPDLWSPYLASLEQSQKSKVYERRRVVSRTALRRTVPNFPADLAAELIVSGEVLWAPPERFDRPHPTDSIESVRQRVTLLEAYRQSPTCIESSDWTERARIDAALIVLRHWLTRRALSAGDEVAETRGDHSPLSTRHYRPPQPNVAR
jgi:hypothetical protein